jgi:plastocyanin
MEQSVYYVVGIVLVLAALVLSALGIRNETFPSKWAFRGGVAVMVLLVAGTLAGAVVNARDEQKKRREGDEAEKRAQVQAEEAADEKNVAADNQGPGKGPPRNVGPGERGPGGGGTTIALSADPSNDFAFDKTRLHAPAGPVTIEFSNPARLAHDVTVEGQGKGLGGTEIISEDSEALHLDLKPGTYTYYCSVPGHREGGMQGTLIVK